MEYSYHLQQRFPTLQVTAEVQQPPAQNRMMASIVSYLQIAGFLVSFFGDQLFAAISMPVPEWARYLQNNRGTAIMIFFVGNMFVNSLTQTGAFEVYLGGELVHSKIQTGSVPDFQSLVAKVHEMNPDLTMKGADDKRPTQRRLKQDEAPPIQKQPRHISQDDDDDEEF